MLPAFTTVHILNNQPPDAIMEKADDEFYIGWCKRGCTGTDQAAWVIKHVAADPGLGGIREITWAEGQNNDFSLVMDDCETYTYKHLV